MEMASRIERLRTMPALGKASREYLRKVIYAGLGFERDEVLVGPKFGVDNAILRIGKGRVLVATTDPLSFIPHLRACDSAWLSVNLLASDLTTSGFPPQYGIFDFNLPPAMKDSDFANYWRSFHQECSRLGLAIVGGHTGRYEGCDYPIIGGGVLFATGSEDSYLTSAMAQAGDDIILTKGAAVETTAVVSRVFPRTVSRALGPRLFARARKYLIKVSTVKEALTAVSVGVHREGVRAMHDATEGGVMAAVLELATASKLGVELDLDSIPISQETDELCRLFKIDPLISLSEGSLIIACRPQKTSRLLRKLSSERIESEVIGRLTKGTLTAYGTGRRGRVRLRYPKFDPYWRAYWRAIRKGWN
jgi:hydrogenase expression/formation protein HypE